MFANLLSVVRRDDKESIFDQSFETHEAMGCLSLELDLRVISQSFRVCLIFVINFKAISAVRTASSQ